MPLALNSLRVVGLPERYLWEKGLRMRQLLRGNRFEISYVRSYDAIDGSGLFFAFQFNILHEFRSKFPIKKLER